MTPSRHAGMQRKAIGSAVNDGWLISSASRQPRRPGNSASGHTLTAGKRRLVSDPQKALSYQRALAVFTRIVDEPASVPGLLQNAAAQVARITHIKHVKILAIAPIGAISWSRPASAGSPAWSAMSALAPTGFPRPAALSKPARRSRSRTSRTIRNSATPTCCASTALCQCSTCPIFVDGTHWGVLEVDTVEKTTFAEFEVHSLAIFANILGVSLAKDAARNAAAKAMSLISDSKSETEIMLRELQHRMKNNLQVIVSFLALQGRESASEEARERIGRVMDRVMAIGLAHDQLSFKKGASTVDMRDYLKALCANIDPRRPNLTIDKEFESISIPLDRAVPIGLILNELVTNSVKYAFEEEGGGVINITFRLNETIGEAELCVRDNGRGMGQARSGSLGLRLVESLSRQLGGRLTTPEVRKGTKTVLTLPYSV